MTLIGPAPEQIHADVAKDLRERNIDAALVPRRQRLDQSVSLAMQGLGMQGGRFEVQLQASAQAQQSGLEDIAFLVAGHAGSTPRPVGKVASGGELSRIALAIAVDLAWRAQVIPVSFFTAQAALLAALR